VSERRRSLVARIGILLLNFVTPGLGLLRVGELRRAVIYYAIAEGAFVVFIAALALTTNISFGTYATAVGLVLVVLSSALCTAIWQTWRRSRIVIEPRPLWSSWYAVVGAVLLTVGVRYLYTGVWHHIYHNFYVPAEGMEPTLDKNDKFVASMRRPKGLHRGDILLVKAPNGATYVKRLAALPGDKIALRDGIVFINGVAATMIPHGSRRVSYPYQDVTEAKVYLEQFPGEARPHLIQDLGASPQDNFAEVTMDSSHVFMLGDNRDDSADSRVPKYDGGLELVPVGNVLGRPLFFYWPRAKMGRSIRDGAQ
jgi:signal peptidase I